MEHHIQKNPLYKRNQSTTINGMKTDKKNLGLIVCKDVMSILTAGGTIDVDAPIGLEVVCKALYSVWEWPEAAKVTFWEIFIGLVTKRALIWQADKFPVDEDDLIETNDCSTWNVITW